MLRRLGPVLVVVGALAAVPGALAAYPTPYAAQDGTGVLSNDGQLRFIASRAAEGTLVSAVKATDGSQVKSQTITGAFGIPMITQNGLAGGLFHDGSRFVLQSMGAARSTKFMLVGTGDLAPRGQIVLKGTFGYDALSPDGSKLYLIQHSSTDDLQRYTVRAYDLTAHKLLPGRIADKAQKSWVMQGFAVNRATTKDGRWVYTLYMNPGGYPFIHALDTVRGVAHCIGLPWTSTNQGPVFQFGMTLQGRSLVVKWQDGRVYRVVDTRSWRLSTSLPKSGLHKAWLGLGGGLAVLAAAGVGLARRHRRQPL